MNPPSNYFRPQQSWAPAVVAAGEQGGRLVAYNNNTNSCDHAYNNLAFNCPTTSANNVMPLINFRQTQPQLADNNANNNIIFSSSQTHHNNQHHHHNNNNNNIHHSNNKKSSKQKCGHLPILVQRSNLVSIKSKIGVEYRRYAVLCDEIKKFDDFFTKVEAIHQLNATPFAIYYSDQDGELLPINNDDNLAQAIKSTSRFKSTHYVIANNIDQFHSPHNNYILRGQNYYQQQQPQQRQVTIETPFLKLFLEKKGIPDELYCMPNSSLSRKRKDYLINMLIPSSAISSSDSRPRIGMPEDFRQVSSIIDVDILPATRRRVVLKRGDSDKPLGFYIRDGIYHRMNPQGVIEKHYGIFISRLVPGGLAESTNLLAENDEILEVNGIDISKEKRLDQVRDMMVANSSNLIITTRPAKPFSHHNVNYHHNRLRQKHAGNHMAGRDRLPSTQSTSSDLGEDYIRHHIH